jgi:hypothetical protein
MAKTLTFTCLVAAAALLLSASAATGRHRSPAKRAAPKPTAKPAPPTGFPSSCEIDQFLDDTVPMSPKERLPVAVAMMNRMLSAPAPRDHDPIGLWDYFLRRWAARFLARGEMDVLEAVDQAPLDTRFSLAECSLFYRAVLKDRRAVEYYRYQSNRGRIALCFEGGELERVLALPIEASHDAPFYLTRVPACEADALIAGLAQGGPRARRVEELIRDSYAEQGDPAGAAYLLARLAVHFGSHPDEAILGGFDNAMRDTPPEKRSCELYWSSIRSKASCAVYKQHYKSLASIPERCVTDGVRRCLEK